MNSYKHNSKLTPNAKKLRQEMTEEEKKLWYTFLKDFTVRFLRQKVIDEYIVDFYCSKAKLVIELDGSQHYEQNKEIKDRTRDKRLEERGLKILRFSNYDLHKNFKGICEHIYNIVYARIDEE